MPSARALSCGLALMGALAWAPPASAEWTAKRLPYGDTYDPPLTHYHLERETRWRLIGPGLEASRSHQLIRFAFGHP